MAVLRAAVRDRMNSHAAEISFFALLSLVPATVTLGGVLHLFAHVGGPALATRAQDGAKEAIRLLIGPKLADSVINPFVQTQLSQSRGLAITGLIATAWLASRMFHALSHGLDVAFGVADRRPSKLQRLFAIGHAIVAVAVVAVTLAVMVLGWHSGKSGLDRFMGRAPVVAQLWQVIRWPLLFVVLLGVIVNLYRYGPNLRLGVRQCLPGACLAVVLWVGAAVGFRAYLLVGAAAPTGVSTKDQQVVLIGRAIGASIGTAVWMYFSSLAILTGAELNGVLLRRRAVRLECSPSAIAATHGRQGAHCVPKPPRTIALPPAIAHWLELWDGQQSLRRREP
jgi:membrane protein